MKAQATPPTAERGVSRSEVILHAVATAAQRLFRAETWPQVLHQVLEDLGQAADVSSVYLFENYTGPDGQPWVRLVEAWLAPDVSTIQPEALLNLRWETPAIQRWYRLLQKGQVIHGIRSQLPEPERRLLEAHGVGSILLVPIFLNGTWHAVLGFAETRYERTWTPPEVEALRAAAGMLAAAWQRHRQQRALRLLRDALDMLNASPYVQDVLPAIARELQAFTQCNRVSIALLEDGNRYFRIIALDTPRPELTAGTRLPVNATSAAEDVLAGRPHLTPDLAQELDKEGERLLYQAGHRSRVNLPLQVEDRVLGALNLTWSHPYGYQEDHIPILMAVARALALAIERTRYIEAVQERQRESEILRRATAALTSELHPRSVLERLLDHLALLIPYDSATVFLHREDHLQAVTLRGLPEDHGKRRFPRDNPLFQEIERTGQPIVLEDASQDPRFENWDVPHPIRAWIGAPLRVRGKVIGFLTVDNKVPGVYTEHHARLVEAIADHAAAAMENARLYQEALLANQELQDALQERMNLIHRVSHELRTPLTLILGLAELLAQSPDLAQASEATRHLVDTLVREAKHMRHMVNQVITWKRAEQAPYKMTLLDLRTWLKDALRAWEPVLAQEHKRLVTEIAPDVGHVQGDPNYLRQVLDNLVDNARKYSPAHSTITVRAWAQDGEVRLAVQDEGIGVPPEKIPFLFEPFFRLERKEEYTTKGMGLGLALCREIVERHGGRIWAESAGEGQGLTVFVSLPRREPDATETA